MHEYKITTPLIDILISDEYLSYEGIERPWKSMMLADKPDSDEAVILERYFYDIQGLISKKLYDFGAQTDFSDTDGLRLVALTQELIKVKKLLSKG